NFRCSAIRSAVVWRAKRLRFCDQKKHRPPHRRDEKRLFPQTTIVGLGGEGKFAPSRYLLGTLPAFFDKIVTGHKRARAFMERVRAPICRSADKFGIATFRTAALVRRRIFVTFREDSSNHTLDDIFAASTFCRPHVAPWISCIGTCSNGGRALEERAWLSDLRSHFRCHSHQRLETPSDSTAGDRGSKRVAED